MEKTLRGACVIGQSGGPTSVINSSAYGVIRTALDTDCITKVYGAAHGIKGVLEDKLYDMGEEDAYELSLLKMCIRDRTMCCPPRRRSCSSAAAPQAADWLRSLWWTCSSPRSATRTTPPWPSRWRRAIPSAASTMPDKRGERRMKITGFRIGLVSRCV